MLANRPIQLAHGSRPSPLSRAPALAHPESRAAVVRVAAEHTSTSGSGSSGAGGLGSGGSSGIDAQRAFGGRSEALKSPLSGLGARALGAACVSASVILFPGIAQAIAPAGNQPPGGGGDGNGGGGGGGGGSGPSGQQPLYELAADEKEGDAKKDDGSTTESEDPSSEERQEEAAADDTWKDLITPSDQIEDVPGQRSGTNRCVELIIEGWPSVGALPSLVSHGAGAGAAR
eukprot:363929-Chlamydomonas_euryale.AAC.4